MVLTEPPSNRVVPNALVVKLASLWPVDPGAPPTAPTKYKLPATLKVALWLPSLVPRKTSLNLPVTALMLMLEASVTGSLKRNPPVRVIDPPPSTVEPPTSVVRLCRPLMAPEKRVSPFVLTKRSPMPLPPKAPS